MSTRRGFFGFLAAGLAALPFVGKAFPQEVTVSTQPYATFMPRPTYDLFSDRELAQLPTLKEMATPTSDPDALKLHEIMAQYRDGYLSTQQMRQQVRALLPLMAAMRDDAAGMTTAGEISSEGDGRSGTFRWLKNPHAIDENADVYAHQVRMPYFAVKMREGPEA